MRTGGPGGGYGQRTRAATLGFFAAAAAVAVETGVAADAGSSTAVAGATATVVAPDTATPCTAPLPSCRAPASPPHCHPGVSYSGRE